MKLLANENLPLDLVEALRGAGHDVAWIRTDAPGTDDENVLNRAVVEDRVLITFDKDFGELAVHRRLPATSGVILCRVSLPSSAEVAARVTEVVSSRQDWPGHFSVIEERRIRMRPLLQRNES